MSEAVLALAGVVVGAIASIGGTVWMDHRAAMRTEAAAKAEAYSLRAALAGEIMALVHLVEVRDYVLRLNSYRMAVRTGAFVPNFTLKADGNYFRIFEANLPKIGLIGDSALDVCRFYTFCMGALEDIKALNEVCWSPLRVTGFDERVGQLSAFLEYLVTHGKEVSAALLGKGSSKSLPSPFA
jgi:hypothetical protein